LCYGINLTKHELKNVCIFHFTPGVMPSKLIKDEDWKIKVEISIFSPLAMNTKKRKAATVRFANHPKQAVKVWDIVVPGQAFKKFIEWTRRQSEARKQSGKESRC